jgi:protein-tyrosine phosphatase
MAEACWTHAAGRRGGYLAEHVMVESAGMWPMHAGEPIDPRARAALVAAGYEPPPEHRARQFMPDWFNRLDLVVPVNASIHGALHELSPSSSGHGPRPPARIRMLPDHAEDCDLNVRDPHRGGKADFAACLSLISQGVDDLLWDLEVDFGLRRVAPYPGDGA